MNTIPHLAHFSRSRPTLWVLAFLALVAVGSAVWLTQNYSNLTFDAVLFLFVMPVTGTNQHLIDSFICTALLWPAGLMLFALAWRFFSGRSLPGPRRPGWLWLGVLVLALGYSAGYMALPDFIYSSLTRKQSNFIQNEYRPLPANLHFARRKNLIWIVMESQEATFADAKVCGQNLMPELTSLPGIRIADHHQVFGSNWTIAGMVSYFTGLPLKVPELYRNKMDAFGRFLPGAEGLTNALSRAGYEVMFLDAGTARFAGGDIFFAQHGVPKDHIKDYFDVVAKFPEKAEGKGPWGLRDHDMLDAAKHEISAMAAKNQPFAFIGLSIDGHPPLLEVPRGFPRPYGDHRDLLLYCDSQFAAFARWAQAQPWFKDTVLVFSNDHLNMGNEAFHREWLQRNQEKRRNFNLIMNAPQLPDQKRSISNFDLLPTVLEALGAQLPERRLGLGVSLFSGESTLIERFGNDLDSLLQDDSTFYNSLL